MRHRIVYTSGSYGRHIFIGMLTCILVGNHSYMKDSFAFAFTKIPKSLIDERHREVLHPHTRLAERSHRNRSVGNRTKKFASANDFGEADFTESEARTKDNPTNDASNQGRLLLAFVAMLYGSLNVSLRYVYDVPDVPPTAAALSATRGWLAFLCFLPPILMGIGEPKGKPLNESSLQSSGANKKDKMALFLSGLELAMWNFFAQGFLNIGLLSTGSARASFLTQTSVLFTPLISKAIGKQTIGRSVWIGCVVALAGLLTLTVGGGGSVGSSALSLSISKGDLFVLGGALSWSMYLFRISFLGPRHSDVLLQGVKTGLLGVFYSVWWMATSISTGSGGSIVDASLPKWMTSSPVVWFALFFSAIGPGTIADVLQQKGQKHVSPSEANIMLSAEPVFATILASLLLGEQSSTLEMVGGGLILAAVIIASGVSASDKDDHGEKH